ncbi:unnamed protein product [Closterium sp. NIES-65]|nr:unnamed protein product [Closterium sp. NIES-65]CAI5986737.1 unnamed protein product [Closterium sp. NIES-65]
MARHGVWLGTAFGSETERDKGSIVGGAALRSASRGCRVQWDRGQRVPHRELEVAKRELRPLLNALRFIESSNRVNCPDGDAGSSIGPLQISEEYHRDAWGHRAGRWTACRELAHAEDTVVRYWLRYCPGAIRAHDWELLAKFHNGGPRGTKHSKTRAYWRKVVRHLAAQQPLGLSGDVPHIPPQLPGTFRAEGLAAECSASSAASGGGAGLTVSAVAHRKQQQSLQQVTETKCSVNEGSQQIVVDESDQRADVATGGRVRPRRGHRRPQQALRAVPWRSPASAAPAPPSPSLESAAHGAALAALSALPFLNTMALDGDADVAHPADELCGLTECASPVASPARATRSATAPPAATPTAVAGCTQTPTPQPQCPCAKEGACGDTEGAAEEGCVAEARAGAGWLLWDSDLAWTVEHHEDFFTPAASLDVQDSVREHRGAAVAADVADKLASLDIGKLVHGMKRGSGREAVAASSDDVGEQAAAERSTKLARGTREGSGDSAHARSAGGASSSPLVNSTAARHASSSECGERGRASREAGRDAPREARQRVEAWLTLVDGGRSRMRKDSAEGKNGAIRPTGGTLTGSREGEALPSPAALPHAQSLHSTPVPWAGAVRAVQAAQGALGAQGARAARPAWAARHGAWHAAAGPSAADKVEAWVHAHGSRGTSGGAAAASPTLIC